MPQPFVSVVIPARDAAGTIGRQLAALDRQTFHLPFEVIVADNGSLDGTLDEVRRWWPERWELRCVDASGHASAARARNVGAAAARAERIAFCDADDEVDQRWLQSLVAAAPTPGTIVAGRVDEKRLNSGNRRSHFGNGESLPTAWWFLPAAPGGNLLVWKADYLDLGGFDETLPYPVEDVDFSWRAQLSGLELRFAPDAILYYRHRRRGTSAVLQAIRYGIGAARLLDRYRVVPGVPTGSPLTARVSVLLGELRRSAEARSAIPVLTQAAYEAAFSCTKATILACRLGRVMTIRSRNSEDGVTRRAEPGRGDR